MSGTSPHHHHDHTQQEYKWLARILGILAAISIGIVACIAVFTVLGWGWAWAIVAGCAGGFSEGVVYLAEMPEMFSRIARYGIDRIVRDSYIIEILLPPPEL